MSSTSLPQVVQQALKDLVTSQREQEGRIATDVLRVVQQQAALQLETELVLEELQCDPFQRLESLFQQKQPTMDRLCKILQVSDCHRSSNRLGYSFVEAVAQLAADALMKDEGVSKLVQLCFQYERVPLSQQGSTTTITYSIDVSRDYGPKERLLWVQVWAAGSSPSLHLPAVNLGNSEDDSDDDGWEDEDDSGHQENVVEVKRQRSEQGPVVTASEQEPAVTTRVPSEEKPPATKQPADRDCYVADMNPDVLSRLLRWTRLGPLDDLTAFFFLMTFPFYEHEWDLVGYVLDGVFGLSDDEIST